MYSVQIAVSNGTLTRISLSIQYFEKDDITLYRNLDTTPLVLGTDWEWDGDTAINLLTGIPVPTGDYITVRRNTNIDRAFNIYDGGAAFSRETLDENFKQMIYLAQEFTEGNGLTGVFFPLDMHGFQIKNLGTPTDPGDAVTKKYVDDANAIQDNNFVTGQAAQDAAVAASQAVQDARLGALENTFVQPTNSYPWSTVTTVETDTLTPGFAFDKAALYLNGIRQTPGVSYIVVTNQILLATAVPVGTVVLAALGEDIDNPDGFVTSDQVQNLQDQIDAKMVKTNNLSDVASVTTARTNLGLKGAATLDVGTTTGTVAAGNDSRIVGAAQKSQNLSDLPDIPTARTNLGLAAGAVSPIGTTAGTILAGNAPGRLLAIQRFIANGTYTPTPGMTTCVIEAVGGGGAGGGTPATAAAQVAAGAGGNSGSYVKVGFNASQIGASQPVTIGAAGAGVSGATGGNGGATLLGASGALINCPGGNGGGTTGAITAIAGGTFVLPSARTTPAHSGSTYSLMISGAGEYGLATTTSIIGSAGGNTPVGAGASHVTNGAGLSAFTFGGGGGGGAASPASTAARSGGNGGGGLMVIYEYS